MNNDPLTHLIQHIDALYELNMPNSDEKYTLGQSKRFVRYFKVTHINQFNQPQYLIFAEFKDYNSIIQQRLILFQEFNEECKKLSNEQETLAELEFNVYLDILSTFYSDANARNNFCQQIQNNAKECAINIQIPIFIFYNYIQQVFGDSPIIMCHLYEFFNLRVDSHLSQMLILNITHSFMNDGDQMFCIRNLNSRTDQYSSYALFNTAHSYLVQGFIQYYENEQIFLGNYGECITISEYKQIIDNQDDYPRYYGTYVYIESLNLFQMPQICKCVSVESINSSKTYQYACENCRFISLISKRIMTQLRQSCLQSISKINLFDQFYKNTMSKSLELFYNLQTVNQKLKNSNIATLQRRLLDVLQTKVIKKSAPILSQIGQDIQPQALAKIDQLRQICDQSGEYSTIYEYDFVNECIVQTINLDPQHYSQVEYCIQNYYIASLMPKLIKNVKKINIIEFLDKCSMIAAFLEEKFNRVNSQQYCCICQENDKIVFKPRQNHKENINDHSICFCCLTDLVLFNAKQKYGAICKNNSSQAYNLIHTCPICKDEQKIIVTQQNISGIQYIQKILYLD